MKKRKFLVPLATILASLGVSNANAVADIGSNLNVPATVHYSAKNTDEIFSFVMKPSNEQTTMAYHYSHSSHSSHSSHRSHSSHYSSR